MDEKTPDEPKTAADPKTTVEKVDPDKDIVPCVLCGKDRGQTVNLFCRDCAKTRRRECVDILVNGYRKPTQGLLSIGGLGSGDTAGLGSIALVLVIIVGAAIGMARNPAGSPSKEQKKAGLEVNVSQVSVSEVVESIETGIPGEPSNVVKPIDNEILVESEVPATSGSDPASHPRIEGQIDLTQLKKCSTGTPSLPCNGAARCYVAYTAFDCEACDITLAFVEKAMEFLLTDPSYSFALITDSENVPAGIPLRFGDGCYLDTDGLVRDQLKAEEDLVIAALDSEGVIDQRLIVTNIIPEGIERQAERLYRALHN